MLHDSDGVTSLRIAPESQRQEPGTERVQSRVAGRIRAAAHLDAAMLANSFASNESVSRRLNIDAKLISRMRNGDKPIQLGDLYLVQRSVALHLLDAMRADLAADEPDCARPSSLEAELIGSMGALGGAIRTTADALEDGRIDAHEVRPLVRALTAAQGGVLRALEALRGRA